MSSLLDPGGIFDAVRLFPTGATRDTESGKLDYEGFLSPLVIRRYAEYMHAHRVQKDGVTRDSDNWQRGMPRSVYMKSMFRHFMEVWAGHRGWGGHVGPAFDEAPAAMEEALCAVMFNAMGYLHTLLARDCGTEVGSENAR